MQNTCRDWKFLAVSRAYPTAWNISFIRPHASLMFLSLGVIATRRRSIDEGQICPFLPSPFLPLPLLSKNICKLLIFVVFRDWYLRLYIYFIKSCLLFISTNGIINNCVNMLINRIIVKRLLLILRTCNTGFEIKFAAMWVIWYSRIKCKI